MSSNTVHEIEHAIIRRVSPNEYGMDQKSDGQGNATWDDPVKLRFGAWKRPDNHYMFAISGDVLTGPDDNPRRAEKLFIGVKLDPNPCLEIYAQRTRDTEEDADMLCVLRIGSEGIELDPKHAGGMVAKGFGNTGNNGAQGGRFYHEGGKFCTIFQNDGHIVEYKIVDGAGNPLPENQWVAVWSNWNGIMTPLPW